MCGSEKVIDVGYDLRGFSKLYLYCDVCGRNTEHEVIGVEDEVFNKYFAKKPPQRAADIDG